MGEVGLEGGSGELASQLRTDRGPAERHRGDGWRSILAGLGAGVVTAMGSWSPSLWSDESATISAATRSIPELWRMITQIDLVHGAYYLSMHFWIHLFGVNQFTLRLPSAFAVAASGAFLYLIAVRLWSRRLATLVAVVFAILPRVSWAGAEARPYAGTIMLATAATLILLLTLHGEFANPNRTVVLWVCYSAFLFVGILCNLYLGLMVAVHLVSILLDRTVSSQERLKWVFSAGTALLASVPFFFTAMKQSGQLGSRAFGFADLLRNVGVNQWFLGETPTTTTGTGVTKVTGGDITSWWAPASVGFAAVSWLLMTYSLSCLFNRNAEHRERSISTVIWSVPWLVVPTLAIGLYSLLVTPMYSARYLSFASPAVSLLIALGLVGITMTWLRVTALSLLLLLSVPVYLSQRQEYAKSSSDWSAVADFIHGSARSGDGVYFAPRYDVEGIAVGRTTRGILTAYPEAFTGLADITLVQSPSDAGNLTGSSRFLADSARQLAAVNTLWFIRRRDYPTSRVAADDAFMQSQGLKSSEQWTGPLDVVVKYERAQ